MIAEQRKFSPITKKGLSWRGGIKYDISRGGKHKKKVRDFLMILTHNHTAGGSELLFVGEKKSIFLGRNKEVLDIAAKETKNITNAPVTIFCDSQEALRTIEHPPSHRNNRFLRGSIYEKTKKLESNKHHVTIRWIPSHSGLAGNERADQAVKNRAERAGQQPERWSSLAHIRKNLVQARSQELTNWHEIKRQERENSRLGYYIPWTKESINSALANAPKKYASRYYQLKVGHDAVGTFLTRIGVIESPECWWCGVTEQSVEHLYTKCRRWRKERRKLVRELGKEGVRWQAQAERRWVAELVASEKAVVPLLRFLKATEIGGREGARDRELEWERRNDQAGEDLLE